MYTSTTKKTHIYVCNGKDCKKNGCEATIKQFKTGIKEKGKKQFRLVKTKCMDYCKLGPNVDIKGQLYHHCTAADVLAFLENSTFK